jgi:hypothetical protein
LNAVTKDACKTRNIASPASVVTSDFGAMCQSAFKFCMPNDTRLPHFD